MKVIEATAERAATRAAEKAAAKVIDKAVEMAVEAVGARYDKRMDALEKGFTELKGAIQASDLQSAVDKALEEKWPALGGGGVGMGSSK
eukprot:12429134-Karenia_brevis.AAC.1